MSKRHRIYLLAKSGTNLSQNMIIFNYNPLNKRNIHVYLNNKIKGEKGQLFSYHRIPINNYRRKIENHHSAIAIIIITGKNHWCMLKLGATIWQERKYLHTQPISPQDVSYKEKHNNFTMEKSSEHHSNQMIKLNFPVIRHLNPMYLWIQCTEKDSIALVW